MNQEAGEQLAASDTDKLEADLKAKYGQVFRYEAEGLPTIYFRKPSRLEYRAFKAARGDESKKFAADEILACACVVHPDRVAFESILDADPVLATSVSGKILESSGGASAEVKKL